LIANVSQRGEPFGVHCTRRHLAGYLKGLPGAASLRQRLNACDSLEGCLEILRHRASDARRPAIGAETPAWTPPPASGG
jgi:tRNA-dihydrouridine synthase